MTRCRALAALPLLVCSLAWGADWTGLSDQCLARPNDGAGRPGTLADACPEVAEALQADAWRTLLLRPPAELGAWSLVDLRALAGHYRRPAAGPLLDPERLNAALAALPRADADEAVSLWRRALSWLERWLGRSGATWPDWLRHLSLPGAFLPWVGYITAALLVLMAALVVGNELRQRSQRRLVPRAGEPGRGGAARGQPSPAPESSPREQVQALFRRVVERLQAAGRLPRRPSLTHREVAAAPGLAPGWRARLSAISHAAERALYGGWCPGPDEVAPLVDDGQALLADVGGEAP